MSKKSKSAISANPLVSFFAEKEADFDEVRTYDCDIFNKEFHFLHSSMQVDKVVEDPKIFKTQAEQFAARYHALACDDNGIRYATTRPQLIDAVKETIGKRSFREHCINALISINEISAGDAAAPLFDDDVVDSDIPGTLENEKKPLSSTGQGDGQ